MFNLYDVRNRANTRIFIVAQDETRAKMVALGFKHSKKESNLQAIDITDKMQADSAWLSLRIILMSEREGQLWKQAPAYTMNEIMAGADKGGGQWIIQYLKKPKGVE